MRQQAILLSKDNTEEVVKVLNDYMNVRSFLEDYGYMLEHGTVVLVTSEIDGSSYRLVSHVVTQSMFWANAKCEKLNAKTFEDVTQR